jgi:membrane protein required for colicin V production
MLSIPDIVLIIIIIILTIRCVVRGFVEEFLSMAALIFGIAGAVFLSGPIGSMIEKYFQLSMWSPVIAFLSCFLIIYLIIKILEGFLHSLFDKLNLEKLDRALGFVSSPQQ